VTRPSRISRAAIVGQLRAAATRGDRAALALAIDQMKTWAYSPRYWEKYLQLLTHPMARLVDLTEAHGQLGRELHAVYAVSARAARMKSLSVRPSILCVQMVSVTLPQPR